MTLIVVKPAGRLAAMKERFLSKSLFVRALECPRKLYYAGKPQYADNSLDDDFLEALAEGGIQVGALARCYYPDGISLAEMDTKTALAKTAELLKREQVTLFEAAIRHGSCLFKADILIKDGAHFDLIEVKAKSYDDDTPSEFLKKKERGISSVWKPYLYDVAFQKHVLRLAFPKATISAYLMLANKGAAASVDGLNQRFVIVEAGGRKTVRLRGDCSPAGLGDPVLIKVPVDDALEVAFEGGEDTAGRSFADCVDWLAGLRRDDVKADWPVGAQCQSCEFRPSPEQRQEGLRSGFCECWLEKRGLTEAELEQPSIFDIWNFRKTADLLSEGRFFMRNLTEDDILGWKKAKKPAGPGLSAAERQWMQVDKERRGDRTVYFDRDGFAAEMAKWRFPLHFIDFETSMVAIPFNRGRYPYEGIAFQFSHHVAHEYGRIEHAGQYLNAQPGIFPNYEFLRALKRELEGDGGTIFRYAPHENTYLNMIRGQLRDESAAEVVDRDELCKWIESISKSTEDSTEAWEGARSMVDMWELVKRYYYDPATQGSNSIKAVLPAVLKSSGYLQRKYGQPIYGARGGIPSLNYRDWTWIRKVADGTVDDPYRLLPEIPIGLTEGQMEYAGRANARLADGAAAMAAYQRLQFTEMPDRDRQELEAALLRYCELDTMAMVMIWEHWVNLLRR